MSINDTTMTGNIVFDPRYSGGNGKKSRTSFRIASTSRHREMNGTWVDGDTTFMDVVCFGTLAEHVVESLGKGSPVIVTGRLQSRTVEPEGSDGRKTTYYEIVAAAVGPDLSRVAVEVRSIKGSGASRQEDRAMAEVADVMERASQVA